MERFTLSDVARIYGVQEVTIKRWIKAKKLNGINPSANRAGPYIFRPEDLDAFDRAHPIWVPTTEEATHE